jgi:5-methyltetrahydrofolate--homocysteine methyltransferase
MHGLDLVRRLTDETEAGDLREEVARAVEADAAPAEEKAVPVEQATPAIPRVSRDVEAPPPPDLERHAEELDLDEVWELVNPRMLYGKHLGLKGSIRGLRQAGDERLAKLEVVVEEMKQEARGGVLSARAVWRFYAAESRGDQLLLRDGDAEIGGWTFPRQHGRDGLCLTDYVLDGDHVALFVTTAGPDVRERVLELKELGEYLRSHTLAALALETAEAAAEWLHRELRRQWGFPDPAELSTRDLFGARYRGKRYSFGYPACPDLAGQRLLFELLRPEEIGVELTEGDMMDPEASVSAIVVHHPEARYFGVGA